MMTIFGRFLQLPQDRLEILGMLGLLQDVGKLKLPTELATRGPTNDAEMELYQTHVNHSVRILSSTPGIPPSFRDLRRCITNVSTGAAIREDCGGMRSRFPA